MAAAQCHKPCEQTCNQGHRESSLSQKVSEMTSWMHKSSSESKNQASHGKMEESQCYAKTQVSYTDQGMSHGHGLTQSHSLDKNKAQTVCMDQNKTNACQGQTKKRGEHKKKGLLRRIKDGLSGGTDSSSSDSESDDDNCGKRKN